MAIVFIDKVNFKDCPLFFSKSGEQKNVRHVDGDKDNNIEWWY